MNGHELFSWFPLWSTISSFFSYSPPLSFPQILSSIHTLLKSSPVMQDKATLGDNALEGRNASKLTEYIRNMDSLVLGHILLSLGMLSSIAIYYSVQAGPVLVLHIVSIIMGTCTHTKKHMHTHTFTQTLLLEWKPRLKKWMQQITLHQACKITTWATLGRLVWKKYLQSLSVHRQSAMTSKSSPSLSPA